MIGKTPIRSKINLENGDSEDHNPTILVLMNFSQMLEMIVNGIDTKSIRYIILFFTDLFILKIKDLIN